MPARAIGVPGCPELAFSTASTERKRTVLIAVSRELDMVAVATAGPGRLQSPQSDGVCQPNCRLFCWPPPSGDARRTGTHGPDTRARLRAEPAHIAPRVPRR